eukprot:5675575-Prymnesium_polylepis.1
MLEGRAAAPHLVSEFIKTVARLTSDTTVMSSRASTWCLTVLTPVACGPRSWGVTVCRVSPAAGETSAPSAASRGPCTESYIETCCTPTTHHRRAKPTRTS